jgi:hypothetical protein
MAGLIQFYEGQNIFVAGATGFLGKVFAGETPASVP